MIYSDLPAISFLGRQFPNDGDQKGISIPTQQFESLSLRHLTPRSQSKTPRKQLKPAKCDPETSGHFRGYRGSSALPMIYGREAAWNAALKFSALPQGQTSNHPPVQPAWQGGRWR